jgi:hypothetical protein
MPARVTSEDPEVHRTFAVVSAGAVLGLLLLAMVMAIGGPDSSIFAVGYSLFFALDLLFIPLSVIAAIYLWRIYLQDTRTRRSWLLLRDALLGTAWTTITVYVGIISVARLLGFGPFVWTVPFTAVAVVLASATTLYMAAIYWLRRRQSGDGSPPPIKD